LDASIDDRSVEVEDDDDDEEDHILGSEPRYNPLIISSK